MAVTPTPPKKLVFHQCMGETSQPSGKSHGPSKWVHQSVTASIFSIWSGAMCLPPHLGIFASHISFFGAFINDPKKSTWRKKNGLMFLPLKKFSVERLQAFKPLGAGSWEWKSSHPPTSQTGRVNPELGPVGVWVYHPISWHNLFHLQPDRWNQCPGGPVWMMRQKSWDFWADRCFFGMRIFCWAPQKWP